MLIQEKIRQAAKILQEQSIDCWITFVRESGINGDPMLSFLVKEELTWHSAFIITAQGESYAIVGEGDRLNIESLNVYNHVLGSVEGIKSLVQATLQKLNPNKIALNYSIGSEICDGITHGMFLTFREYMQEIGMADRITSAEKIISSLRGRKSKTEQEWMKEACKKAMNIFHQAKDFIRPGLKAIEIADFIRSKAEEEGLPGAWDSNYCPAVFTGPGEKPLHHPPSEDKVVEGDLIYIDFGVKVNGYCSDLQRTFYMLPKGETEIPNPVIHGFETLVESIERVKQALKPGVLGLNMDKIAREYIVEQGYKDFPHGLGHQVGQYAHDGTALLGPAWEKYANKPFEPIEGGMVFTIEPRLYVEGHGTVSIEEMVVVTEHGSEWMIEPQKELWVCK